MTNEQNLEVVMQHARDAIDEAQEDDGWVLIKAEMLSLLLEGIERLRNKVAALTLVAYGTPENPKDPLRAVEPRAEREGVTFGCSGCSATVTLLFTDASKKTLDIMPMNGWVAGTEGCYCPRCSPNRPAEPR